MFALTRKHKGDHFPEFVETLIIFVILLVIAHTVLEELSIIYHWDHRWIQNLTIAAFAFDAIFTLEFFGRSIISLREEGFVHYLRSERGWIDFLTSIPLLLFVSGPALYLILSHSDEGASKAFQILVVLKTAKAIRVTRVLRLIRVIKLFGKIQNAESVMANRHIGMVSTIAVVSLVCLMVISQVVPLTSFGDHEAWRVTRTGQLDGWVKTSLKTADPDATLQALVHSNGADVIGFKDPEGKVFYQNPEKEKLNWTSYGEWIPLSGGYSVELSYFPAEMEHARFNLVMLFAILFIISGIVIFYSRLFAQQVSDPIYVMDRGMRQWDYNLEVKVIPGRESDEVFRLASVYNNRWLSLKNQILNFRKKKQKEKSVLSVEDLL